MRLRFGVQTQRLDGVPGYQGVAMNAKKVARVPGLKRHQRAHKNEPLCRRADCDVFQLCPEIQHRRQGHALCFTPVLNEQKIFIKICIKANRIVLNQLFF